MQDVYSRVLQPADRFVLIARDSGGESMLPWLQGWLLSKGFVSSEMGNPAGITVLQFRRRVLDTAP